MSLQLSFCYTNSSDCKSILFKESTGTYNVDTNPGGWGTPNTDIADIVSAELVITKPDGDEVTITLDSALFPTTNENIIYKISAESLGYSSTIETGLYNIKYKLTKNDDTIVSTNRTFLYACTMLCQINKILADSVKFQMDCDNCNNGINEDIQNAMLLKTLYEGVCAMSECGTATTKINNALTNLKTLINNYDATGDCGCA